MSVINQVLNQLEQRGAHAAAEQPMVRAVQRARRNLSIPLLLAGSVLIAAAAAWKWMPPLSPAAMPANVAPNSESAPGASAIEKSTAQQQSVATATAPAPKALPSNPPAVPFAPVSRLSLELSQQPLPPTRRPAVPPVSSGKTLGSNTADNSAPADKPKTGKPETGKRAVAPTLPAPAAIIAEPAPAGAAPMKQISTAQRADAEFRRAATLMRQGHIAEAMAGYEDTLRLDAGHEGARQALVALLLEDKRNADAEAVLLEGLKSKPEQTVFTMLLARLQVERGALEQAISTLEVSLPFAEKQDDYRAFLAALLQRQNRNEEAIHHYQIVLQHAPNNGIWLMGLGISLQAVRRNVEASIAFKRALDTKQLSPELQEFVQQRLKGL